MRLNGANCWGGLGGVGAFVWYIHSTHDLYEDASALVIVSSSEGELSKRAAAPATGNMT